LITLADGVSASDSWEDLASQASSEVYDQGNWFAIDGAAATGEYPYGGFVTCPGECTTGNEGLYVVSEANRSYAGGLGANWVFTAPAGSS
jgi:hypothetical protein